MGTNRRYAEALQRKRFNREAEARALIPVTLTEAELGDDPVHRGSAVPVRAWVQYGTASVQVLGSAVAWTRRAVLVFWTDSHDQRHEAWLWAGSVERVEDV